MIKISKKEKDELRNKLYERDGRECYYCEIEEKDFISIWGEFYGGKTRKQGDGSLFDDPLLQLAR